MTYSIKEQLRKVRRMHRELSKTKTVGICVDEDGREYPTAEIKPGDTFFYRQYGCDISRV